jgi:DeoR family fructose operon transcriptional repressor
LLDDCAGVGDSLRSELTLLGGHLRPQNISLVGGFAEAMLDQLWFDQLFLGTGAIDEDCCLYSLNEEEARLNGKMLSRATSKNLLVGSSKFGRRLTYRVAKLSADTAIVTDDGITLNWKTRLKEAGCETRVVTGAIPASNKIRT